jgi:hypothetical protein
MTTPPPCLQTLLEERARRDEEFLQACEILKKENIWSEPLNACFTQNKTWRGGWDRNGCPFSDSTISPLLDRSPNTIEKTEQGQQHLLTALVLPNPNPQEIPYHFIHGDVSPEKNAPSKNQTLYAPHLLEVRGNLHLGHYAQVYLPHLQRVWGSLTLPQNPQATFEAPHLTVIGGDLIDEGPETTLQSLVASGGALCIEENKHPSLPALQWVGTAMRLPKSQTLSAPQLLRIGPLLAPQLSRLELPVLETCVSIESAATSCELPKLTHCHFMTPSVARALSLTCLEALLHQKSPPPPELQKTLVELYEKKLRKMHALRDSINTCNHPSI